MSNDLGGAAKILWSIDDTTATDDSGNGSIDLLTRDGTPTSIPEKSDLGALISIVDGMVRYDTNALDWLAAGQKITDKFTYAIRLANGTLSWATVYVTLTGTNDGASISGTATGAVTEDDATKASASGTLTVSDVDTGEAKFQTVAGSALTGDYGTFTFDADTGKWTFAINNGSAKVQALAAGATATQELTVKSADGTATETIKVTITGTNDGVTTPAVYTGSSDSKDFDDAGPSAGSIVSVTGNLSNGTDGNDLVNGGNGSDTIYGHDGADSLNGMNGSDIAIYGQRGDDNLTGGSGADVIYGGSGNDTLWGNAPPISNESGDSGDELYGGSGNDIIYGQGGNDLIVGGFGADTLQGGGGADTFRYLDLRDTGDTINGFVSGSDKIDFSLLDANPLLANDQSFTWGGSVATAHGAWFEVKNGDAIIYVDTDGDLSTAELSIVLTGVSTLTSNDLIL
jgi:VCBS repeat-containing protein